MFQRVEDLRQQRRVPITPVVTALSGQRSRISKIQGTFRNGHRAATQAGITAIRGGDVPITTSRMPARSAALDADSVNPKKAHMRPR